MKRSFPILLFLTGTAAAGKITLEPVAAADGPPSVVGSYAVCKDGHSYLRSERLELSGHEVVILRECDRTTVQLAFQSKDSWYVFSSGTLGGDSTTFATLRKKRALLHRIDTSTGEGDALHATSRIDVCTYNDKDVPLCGHVEVECPETGCKPPEILKNALWLHAKGGRQKFTISP